MVLLLVATGGTVHTGDTVPTGGNVATGGAARIVIGTVSKNSIIIKGYKTKK